MTGKIKKIIFIMLAICSVFIVLEISFRIIYSLKYRNLAYMAFGINNVFKFDVDRFNEYIKLKEALKDKKGEEIYLGFRTAHFSVKKPDGEYRIVALGESSTFGLYGGYYESWPYLLEQKLSRESNGYNYKVINAGIPGQTTYGIHRLLKSEILSWKPDMVILYALYNHIDIDMLAFYRKNKADFLFRLFKALFYDKSLLMRHAIDFIGSRSNLLRDRMNKYRYLLTEIAEECKKEDTGLIVIKQLIEPERFDRIYDSKCRRGENVYSKGKYYEFSNIIDEVCDKYDCATIDFSTESAACKGKLDLILEDKVVHLSDYGKNLLADVVSEKIIEMQKEELL